MKLRLEETAVIGQETGAPWLPVDSRAKTTSCLVCDFTKYIFECVIGKSSVIYPNDCWAFIGQLLESFKIKDTTVQYFVTLIFCLLVS